MKDLFREQVETMLEPCAACCLDDKRDYKRVVDTIVRNLRPKPIVLAHQIIERPAMLGIYSSIEEARKSCEGFEAVHYYEVDLSIRPLVLKEVT
jgi:hypothetical protein